MAKEGNGQPILFKITFVGSLAQELKALYQLAKGSWSWPAYLEALRTAVFRMQNDPWHFGEIIGRREKPLLSIHVRVVKPLIFEFAIHEERPIVLIRRVQLMI